MFLETAIAMFVLGVIAGAWIVQLLRADTLMSENLALKQQQANRSWEREREAMEYEAFVNTHRGTPYLPKNQMQRDGWTKLIAEVDEVAGRSVRHLDDNDRWSVKAPELRSVS